MAVAPEILELSVADLSARLRARKLSSRALTEAYLARIEQVSPRLGDAFITVTAEVALAEARDADRELSAGRWRGPLHGVPYGLKDLFDTRGIRTTFGARPYARRVPEHDAAVVTRLREAGAVLLGKLAMIELAGALGVTWATASITGACRTPWDRSRWAGGSSGGPAAAVAASLVGFALGTETVGSLMCPAAWCGVTAFRPTYGLVSRRGVMPFAASFDKVGPVGRSAEDCGLVLSAIAGRDPDDPSSVEAPRSLRGGAVSVAGLRVAAIDPPRDFPIDPSIEIFYDEAIQALRHAGMKVERRQLPPLPWQPVSDVIIMAEGVVAFEGLIRSGRTRELADPLHHASHGPDFYRGRPLATDYVKAQALRGLMQREMDRFFSRHDLILNMNAPILPPRVDELLPPWGGDDMRYAANLLGLPGVALPMGFVQPGKLPVGIKITGPAMSDARVLAAGRAFQKVTGWHLERPSVA